MTEQNSKGAALVTGGAIRLGKALALRLAREGYDIALHYGRSADAAEATCAEVRALDVACETFSHDLADAAGIDGLLDRVHARFPNLTALVNSASGYTPGTIAETTPEQFDELFAVNLKAPLFLMQAFAKRCGNGAVVNVLDNKIAFHQFEYAAYLLTKKGLADLTRMAALEFAPTIRVNGVAPGVVLPAGSRSEEYVAWRVQGIPLQRQGSTDHIADAVLAFLDNDFATGQVVMVDGGEGLGQVGRNATQFDPDMV